MGRSFAFTYIFLSLCSLAVFLRAQVSFEDCRAYIFNSYLHTIWEQKADFAAIAAVTKYTEPVNSGSHFSKWDNIYFILFKCTHLYSLINTRWDRNQPPPHIEAHDAVWFIMKSFGESTHYLDIY